ncbi:Ras GTPase activating protein ira2 [Ceratocystis pirilliformis]|uniref:5'-3' exoribonuclease n=1 Tax=Ceratocystis pirilliformis TaxID=259994 RepID=A0ABR3ZB80_9PEZI
MGIPAAFRWLSNKYPKIISPVEEDKPLKMEDGSVIPINMAAKNPNGEEFDNLYLDMNGIVHPCSHPEDRPAPADEEEMMLEVFRYTDRVLNMVRPRKVLMIAVDGVAPRAKMNQQRSRRFRANQEAKEKALEQAELLKSVQKETGSIPSTEQEVVRKAFDSNSITPGTPFMDILASSLRYWCAYKLNTDEGWANLKIIISDATVPGEGEHKIMDFIRSQRTSPNHDPNTRHVMYGLDADLIMLGLATHEPYFRVLREDVFYQDSKARMCRLCGQKGHEARNCRGATIEMETAKAQAEEAVKSDTLETPLKPFIWLHVSVLREYLAVELHVPQLPFKFDVERAIDDWIFLCCFVGNDFLPHLPALEIRENGIDVLTTLWRDNLPIMGGYVTKDGVLDLSRAQTIMDGLGKQEDAIFKRRKDQENRREANAKRRRLDAQARNDRNTDQGRQNHVVSIPNAGALFEIDDKTIDNMIIQKPIAEVNTANKSAASVLKAKLQSQKIVAATSTASETAKNAGNSEPANATGATKRKADAIEDKGREEMPSQPEEPADPVRLWEDGYADRYYEAKFHKDPRDVSFRQSVAESYIEGLAWVLRYYFQGCPSWEWYYPYHYAPFAQDFTNISNMKISFTPGRIARPFEQLMSVLPAGSRHALPEVFHDLMLNEESDIIDFYPEDFEVDLNGKKMAWQGVALLPFIDMPRLLKSVQAKYPELNEADKLRNQPGHEVLILCDKNEHGAYDDITINFYSKKKKNGDDKDRFELDSSHTAGLTGWVEKIPDYTPHGALVYPLERKNMPDIDYDRSISVYYTFPEKIHGHKSMLLRGVKLPTPALNRQDVEMLKNKMNGGGGRSYGGAPLNHNNNYNPRHNQGPIHYGSGRGRGGYNREGHGEQQYQNGNRSYAASSSGYNQTGAYPPPPGVSEFRPRSLPAPPPAAQGFYNNNGRGGSYNGRGGYGRGHNNQHNDHYNQTGYSGPRDSYRGRGNGGGGYNHRGGSSTGSNFRGRGNYRGSRGGSSYH